MRPTTTITGLLLAVVLTTLPAMASEPTAEDPEAPQSLAEGWTFTVAPYVWLPALDGTVGSGGATASVDVSIGDELDLIGDGLSLWAVYGHLEAQRGRFFGYLDTSVIGLDTSQHAQLKGIDDGQISTSAINVDAKLRLDGVLLEFVGGYRALEYPLPNRARPFTLDVMVGGRYYYFWQQVKAKASTTVTGTGPLSRSQIISKAGRLTDTTDWFDPIIGLRWSLPLLDPLDLLFRGDIGGFGAGSDLAWSLTGLLRWHFYEGRCFDSSLVAGYRILDFDYERGGTTLDLSMLGPVLGLALVF